MPELPESPPPIFALPVPRVNERTLLNLARRFKLKAGGQAASILRDAFTFTYSEGAFDLTLHRASGAFRFKNRERWQVDHGGNVELSDDEAIKLARAHLRRYKLLPKNSRVLRVSRLHVAAAGPDRIIEDHRVIDVAVSLQPIIRGVPVDGPGKVMVYLDHEGKLTCLDHISRRIGRVYRKVTELHSPEHAVEEASRMWEKRGVVGEVEIGEVRFCYYELGWNDEQRHLQPAYFVLATLIGPDKRIRTGDIHVTPAAVNNVGRVMPPPPRRVAQKPRPRMERQ